MTDFDVQVLRQTDATVEELKKKVDALEGVISDYMEITRQIANQVNRIVLYLASVQKACEQGDNEE